MSVIGDYKITNRNDPGDSDQYGTDDLEIVMRLLKGILTGTQPPLTQIKSAQGWEWWPGISPVWIRDIDGTHKIQLLTENMTVDANLTIPAISAASKFTIDTIGNQFTAIQKFDNALKFKPIAIPTTDAAYGEVFVDVADNKLKYKNPAGTTIDLTAAAGVSAPTTAQYVTVATDPTLTNERILTGSEGINFVDAGAGNSITAIVDFISLAKRHVGFIDDFFGDSSTGGTYFQISTSGGTVSNLGVNETGIFGAWQLSTSSSASGRASIGSGNNNSFSLGQGSVTLEMKLKNTNLSTSAERYKLTAGLADSTSGTYTDTVCFIYDESVSPNWRIQTMSNTTPTLTTTATVHTNGWEVIKMVVNAAATSASFYVNGVEVSGSPISTNIPSGANRELTVQLRIEKSVGTTGRTCNIDYAALDIRLTNPR